MFEEQAMRLQEKYVPVSHMGIVVHIFAAKQHSLLCNINKQTINIKSKKWFGMLD